MKSFLSAIKSIAFVIAINMTTPLAFGAPPAGWPEMYDDQRLEVRTSLQVCLSVGLHPGEVVKQRSNDDASIYSPKGNLIGYSKFWQAGGSNIGTCEYVYHWYWRRA